MLCCKTFTHKYSKDFKDWSEWVLFVNSNYAYTQTKSTVFDWTGKCKDWELPSSHPFWTNQVKINNLATLENLKEKYKECKINPDKIKYHFNLTTTLEMIANKIYAFEQKTQGIVYQ